MATCNEAFNTEKTACVAALGKKLRFYLPYLCHSLFLVNDHELKRRTKANEILHEYRMELEHHRNLFGDSAKSREKDITIRMNEMIGIIDASKITVQQVATRQTDVWKKCIQVLLKDDISYLSSEFKKLWRMLSKISRQVIVFFRV